MGRRGPRPTPTPLRLLRGETRPSRVNFRAPQPLRDLPAKPADLAPRAAAVWDEVIAGLGHTGVLSAAAAIVIDGIARQRSGEDREPVRQLLQAPLVVRGTVAPPSQILLRSVDARASAVQ
jgi:hypothetical protein